MTIVGLRSRTHPQFIDTGVEIKGLALACSVLLVMGLKVAARLLTQEGFGNIRI